MFKSFQENRREEHVRVGRSIAGERVIPEYNPVKGWFMRRVVAALLLIASATAPAKAQVCNLANLDRLNRKLHGRVVDFTQNHGADRRIWSPVLGRPRDLYVVEVPTGRHNLLYIERAEPPTFLWLGHHILPPARR
jgi:hypothetical protein